MFLGCVIVVVADVAAVFRAVLISANANVVVFEINAVVVMVGASSVDIEAAVVDVGAADTIGVNCLNVFF